MVRTENARRPGEKLRREHQAIRSTEVTTNRTRLAETPYLDAWREELRQAVDGHGKRTELAHHLAKQRDQPVHTWKMGLTRILNGSTVPNGETVLAISAWMKSRSAE